MTRRKYSGSITLELLIAFGVFTLVLSAVILAEAADDPRTITGERNALAFAEATLYDAIAADSFISIVSTTTTESLNGYMFTITTEVTDVSACLKEVAVNVKREGAALTQGAELVGSIGDTEGARALGGDCEAASIAWDDFPDTDTVSLTGASATAVDSVGGHTYVGLTTAPYLAIFDGEEWSVLPGTFTLPAQINELDAVIISKGDGTYERYVYAAIATTTPGQIIAIDVTDPEDPSIASVQPLAGVTSTSTAAHGAHVRYYDGRVYVANGYIIGAQPELHIFDAGDPGSLTEIGSSNINTSIYDMQIRDGLLFAATANNTKELAVYDVETPSSVSATPIAVSDFGSDGGGDGGKSVAVRGDRLYFGRSSNTDGPEFYIFDISTLSETLTPIGSGEVPQKDVSQIVLQGNRAFLSAAFAATPSTRRVELWDIEDETNPERIDQYSFASMVPKGLEFVNGSLLVAKESDPLLTYFSSL